MAPRFLIVDDEPLARARLNAQLAELHLGKVVGEAGSGIEALRLINALAPTVVLLDIRMPGMNGLEVAQHIGRLSAPPAVIFTTAYDEHALAAFDLHAVDYLLKPIRAERLCAAVVRARLLSAAQLQGITDGVPTLATRTHFSAYTAGVLRVVPLQDVRYLQVDHGYVTVVHVGGELLIDGTLRTLEVELATDFMRIHRHTLVAVAHVLEFKRNRLGNGSVILRDIATPLSVSRRLLSDVRKRLRDWFPR